MSKQEFLDQLRRSISSINDYEFVNDTIAYYEDYIESEIRKGSTLEAVLGELGDPRLIAKSIVATHDFEGDVEPHKEEQKSQKSETVFNRRGKTYRMPTWLFKVLMWVVIIVVIVIAFFILQSLFPVIVVGALAYMLYKFIKQNFL